MDCIEALANVSGIGNAMKIGKVLDRGGFPAVCRILDDSVELLHLDGFADLSAILASKNVMHTVQSLRPTGHEIPLSQAQMLPPIDSQEVWAAGVTYRRSQTARMEESEAAASCYDRVYSADRPEIFFKASPHRVCGTGQPLRIRCDAQWNVPEPELALVLSPRLDIIGFTIGNDMSSRDIEGDNPLYLPQAKVYDQCCGLGPWITLAESMPPNDQIRISMAIQRDGQQVFADSTSVSQMARSFQELVQWLGRDNSFPHGAFLLTGTGIVPGNEFTLRPNDIVTIEITGIGSLHNWIVQQA